MIAGIERIVECQDGVGRSLRAQLLLSRGQHQIFAWKRRESLDQKRGLQQPFQIDFHRRTERFVDGAGQHLTGSQFHAIGRVSGATDVHRSLENNELVERVRAGRALAVKRRIGAVVLRNHGRARDRRRHRRGIDFGAASILRDTEENGAATQLDGPRSFVETENRIRSQPGDGEIDEGELCPRLHAGPNGGVVSHFVVHHRRARRGLSRKKFYILDDLGDARLLQFRGGGRGGEEGDGDGQNGVGNFHKRTGSLRRTL